MTYMILIANSIVKQSKRQKAGKLYLWILITMYYLLSKIWDIFATRRRILLEINKNYFRGGEVIHNHSYKKRCDSNVSHLFFRNSIFHKKQ